MTAPTVTRAQAYANARAALDQARARRDADRAAGRLTPHVEALLADLETHRAPHRAAA